VGMRQNHLKRGSEVCPTLNINKLWGTVGEDKLEEARKAPAGKAMVIDLAQYGYFKLLGKGDLPKVPVIVKARFVSKGAEEQILAAGGAVVLTA
jgi:large subunit ribosomal protein L27Ae